MILALENKYLKLTTDNHVQMHLDVI